MEIDLRSNEFYELLKRAIREVIREERIETILNNLDDVSKEEMEDIESLYGKPSTNKEIGYSEEINL